MSALSIQVPFPVFQDRDGQPLDNGYIWIGTANLNPQTNPVVAYYDEALTIVAAQPLRTLNGYISRAGTPAQIYVNGVDYSILVQDSKGSMVYNFPDGTGISPNASGVSFIGFKGQVGFVQDLADNNGSDWIGFQQAGTGAVAISAQDKMRQTVSAKDFGAVGNGLTNDTAALQAAVNYAFSNGKALYVPSGTYLAKIVIPLPDPGFDFRGYVFNMYGDGAPNGFLGGASIKGTTIISPDTSPTIRFNNRTGFPSYASAPHIYIEKIRFEGNSANPVALFERFSDYSVVSQCEFKQLGNGDGVVIDHGYGGTFTDCHILKTWTAPGTFIGTGFSVSLTSVLSGGLLRLQHITSRGFANGYAIGGAGAPPAPSLLSVVMEQCECSTMDYGILVGTGVRKTVINDCYFEGIENTCVYDRGTSTTVSNSFFIGTASTCFDIGIRSTDTTYGNVYFANEIQLSQANSIGIDLFTDGDANGRSKVVRDNFIYNNSASAADINGVKLTGANPTATVQGNTFRPRRAWPGTSTLKINDLTTGINTGVVPLTDTLNEFPLYSNINISLANGGTLTQTSVTAGVLAMGASSFVDFNPSAPTNVSQLSINGVSGRIVLITCNTNGTLVDGPFMVLAGSVNFTGSGQILLNVRILGGVVYAYEISRALF
jgi:hypothetical protein